ncbi:hypothetical protein B0T26DRAFT_675863 [Lasiosphaeria miniovina]|uniref:Uncharacterized protein n=1 Tax=Lasiosphaeria miniovina TaxID=1954250 RepID=A0AA40AKL5_9PEZI|nr:uncharacterized protein B0T26DRAFT_675863 [Lasiosphaeria miniovina]KAK0717581.1 hypothetical protein B0T26DRAFT_675863 [Lasiosphaeria miniovina]
MDHATESTHPLAPFRCGYFNPADKKGLDGDGSIKYLFYTDTLWHLMRGTDEDIQAWEEAFARNLDFVGVAGPCPADIPRVNYSIPGYSLWERGRYRIPEPKLAEAEGWSAHVWAMSYPENLAKRDGLPPMTPEERLRRGVSAGTRAEAEVYAAIHDRGNGVAPRLLAYITEKNSAGPDRVVGIAVESQMFNRLTNRERAFGDISHNDHRALLAVAQCPGNGQVLHGRVPLRLDDMDTSCGGKGDGREFTRLPPSQ